MAEETRKYLKIILAGIVLIIVFGVLVFVQNSELNAPSGKANEELTDGPPLLQGLRDQSSQLENQTGIRAGYYSITQLTERLISTNGLSSKTTVERNAKSALLNDIVKQRKTLIKELIRENPRIFLSVAMSKTQRSVFPENIQNDIEQEKTAITAKIEVLHIDDFENPKNSRYEYFLKTSGERLNFYPTQDIPLVSGTTIQINKGFQLEETLVADASKSNLQVLTTPPLDSVGEQKTLVFLIKRPDELPLFSREQAYDLIFNSQFQNFMREQSYNQVFFSGDVYGWINLAQAGCVDPALDSPAIRQFITDNNINLANYHRVLFLISFTGGGCSFVGRFDITIDGNTYRLSQTWVGGIDFSQPPGWGEQPFQWTNLDFLLAHELGHALGVFHANGWDCGNQILYGDDCYHWEYGNLFDTMGPGRYSLHFNAIFKELLGWLEPSRILTITRSGTYTINNLESNFGVASAKIQILNTDKTSYYLEYRKGIGFDSKLNNPKFLSNQDGLFVNTNTIGIARWGAGLPSTSHLLDMSPTSLDWWDDTKQTTLNSLNVFNDPGTGITIGPIVSTTSSAITFDVNVEAPICVRQKPYPELSLSDKVAAGEEGWVTFIFFNRDSFVCGQSEFQVSLILPPALRYSSEYPLGNIPLLPRENGWKSISFSVPADTAAGLYEIGYEIVNLNSGLEKTGEFTVTVVEPPVISSINPLSGPIGTKVVLSGSGFDLMENTIYFNSNAGAGWKEFYSIPSPDTRTLEFEIPATIDRGGTAMPTPNGIYKIRVGANNAMSNAVYFEVIPPSITVISPAAGAQWLVGSNQTIGWSSASLPAGTTISLTLTNRTTRVTSSIASGLLSTQTRYSWTIPSDTTPGTDYIISVTAYWSIAPPIVATTANSNRFSIVAPTPTQTNTPTPTPTQSPTPSPTASE